MNLFTTDQAQMTFIHSDDIFQQAKSSGFWEIIRAAFTHSDPYLPSIDPIAHQFHLAPQTYRGVEAIPVSQIVGSTGRRTDFTRHFAPWQIDHERGRESRLSPHPVA